MAFQRRVDRTWRHLSYNWLGTRSLWQNTDLLPTTSRHPGVGHDLTCPQTAGKKIDGNDSRSQLNGKELPPRSETRAQKYPSTKVQSHHSVHTCYCYSPSLCQHQIWMGYSSHSLCVRVQACRRVCRAYMCVRRLESSRTFIYYVAGEEIERSWVRWWHILKGLHSLLFLSPLLFPIRTFDIGQCLKKWASLQFRFNINGARGNTMYMRAFLNHLTFLLLGDSS